MGTRQLQRLQAQHLAEHSSSESSDEAEVPAARPAFFALLGDDEDVGSEAASDTSSDAGAIAAPSKPVQLSKAQKRGATKIMRGKAAAGQPLPPHESDDVDAVLAQLGVADCAAQGEPSSSANVEREPRGCVVSVDKKHLDPDHELRGMLGASLATLDRQLQREEGGAAAAGGRGGRGRQGRRRGRGGAAVRTPMLLSKARAANDRPYDGSLELEKLRAMDGGGTAFVYKAAGAAYRTATAHFEQAQASHDPNQLMTVLQQYPFHVETLLAMVDFYQATDQNDYASVLLDRALFALESAWLPSFKSLMLSGAARLPAAEGRNALFLGTAGRQVRALIRRGCPRTALEWAKMILSLDRNDPCGMLFHLDYCALRSRQYGYIHELIADFQGVAPLPLLPSYAFSAALAHYQMYKDERERSGEVSVTATGVHSSHDNLELDAKLASAILTFPSALTELVDAMREKGAANSAAWQALTKRSLFTDPPGSESATLTHLSRVFATRHADLWKIPDALAWLLRCAEAAANAADAAAGGETAAEEAAALHESQTRTADARALTDVTYPPSATNDYAFVDVSHYADTRPQLAPEQVAALQGGPGPGAGEDELGAPEIMALLEQLAQRQRRGTDGQALTDEELQTANPVVALLQTLLPWVNVRENPEAAEPATAPEIPQALWGAAIANFPGLAEHLSEQRLAADREPRSDEERAEIGRAMAAWLLERQ